ncbi:hypothetical protein QC763_304645 [Podospora pseudopauciseta]|uniref:C2H2-type domain-containing protein n=2 Tax=Podospora TaxID=5144 RepID=A0ABR0HFR5_9PEZI|nr:hypothetical protein QC763_304645 [Podospora pseudopauciseta]KAK4678110.1 hypothetical protein QC764_304645 [Podospora pseudoanserina]
MPWGAEIDASESVSDSNDEGGVLDHSDEGEGHQDNNNTQHLAKRRRMGDNHLHPSMEGNGNVAPVAGMGGGGVVDPSLGGGGGGGGGGGNDGRVPHFKPGLPDPDDKGENDCFFEDCQTRAGGNQYFIKHLMDKHGLIRGDQGRQEGGRRKAPKYLAVCPTNWPFNYGTSSSCGPCSDITTLLNVVGEHNHESPAICSFCWTYFGDRAGLAAHINQGPCRSNEGFSRKLTLIRHMFATALRIPDGPELAKQSEGQRRAHAEAERAARAEKYAAEQLAEQEWRNQQQAQRRQRQQRGGSPPMVAAPAPAVQAVVVGNNRRRTTGAVANGALQGQQQQQVVQQPGFHGSPMGQQFAISAGGIDGLPGLAQQAAGVSPGAAPDYVVPAATAEAMARSIERLSGIIGDLTATNSQLLQELRSRDQHISNRDIQIRSREERINALSAENKKLSAEVARLTAIASGQLGIDGAGGVVMGGDSGLDQGEPMEDAEEV